ncbi:glutathione S-transferase U10-like [Solanum lycopersicum]|uniref:Glutathione S-transferase n=1 Tax=Solanum lycopersicum TaxID=4081 RepID=A0A3Q7FSH1_SOLLC|nr:glutathione S-transferase U10-like [Solanum lycopersicum]
MEEENDRVTLHGMWISTYAKKVELALKIKGIAFDYVEEDLSNKSSLLLKYNPIHKKVPLLLHRGKPLSESLVILEYIDETWNNLQPLLLPEDPYERATVRLWASYCLQISDTMKKAFISARDVEGGAFDELFEILKVMEEGMKDFFPGGRSKICAENLGLLDIIIVCSLATYKAAEEVVGTKILDPEKNPFVYSWVTTLLELPLVKETLPPHDKLVSRLDFIKKNGFRFQSNI